MVATGRVAERVVAVDGLVAVRPRMWANVAIDHRAADGEAGGRLLAALERRIAALPGGTDDDRPVPVDEAVPAHARTALDDAALLALYREMVRVRAFEDEVIDAFAKGLIPGSTHPCIGAEAIKAGAISALRPDDLVFATYRGHGEALLKGVDPVGDDGRADGPRDGRLQGQGRLDAPVRAVGRTHLDERHRRRPHPDGRRGCALLPVPGDRAGRALLLRRRRLVRGRVLRGDEHGDAVEGAARLHLREQRRRDLGADVEEPGDAGHRRPSARLRHAGHDRRRQRRARRARRRRRGRRAGARRRRADVRRVQDGALGTALGLLRRRKRPRRAATRVAARRPDPALPQVARRLGRRDRRATRRRSTRRSWTRCATCARRPSGRRFRRPSPSTRMCSRRSAAYRH